MQEATYKTIIFITVLSVILLLVGVSKMTGNVTMTGNTAFSEIQADEDSQPVNIKLTTSKGDILIELYTKEAPITVNNFLEYVNSGSYNGTVFHRVISEFMIQGGGFMGDGSQGATNAPIELESNNGLSNMVGYVAMARTNVEDSATNQFFINTNNNVFLDYAENNPGYAVFGKVVEGMDVVNDIEASETTIKNNMKDWPVRDIIIISAEII